MPVGKSSRLSIINLTAGGLQLWTDHVYRDGYRIQQHSLTDGWRLLDSTHHRIKSGTRQECILALDQLAPRAAWSQVNEPFVVLLHGLLRTAYCMRKLQSWLTSTGFKQVLRYSYASSRTSILEHGDALVEYIESLPPHSKLSFVGHSMGNIVLRAAIGKCNRTPGGQAVLNRFHRVVMLGPPNQGAMFAKRLSAIGIFALINGPGGMELGPRWDQIKGKLGTPPCPFAILAGDRTGRRIQNPFVEGASDFFVRVEEAKLAGAAEVKTLPVPHTTLMTDRRALEYVSSFLGQK